MLKDSLRNQGAVATAQPLDASFVGFVSKADSVVPAFLSHFSVKVTFKYLQLFLPAPDLGLELARVGEERGCTAACVGLASLGTQNSGLLWHWWWGSLVTLAFLFLPRKNVYF